MDTKQIISSIESIYERFFIPQNLAKHMFEVTAVAKIILAHWKGPTIDSENLIAALLTHDLGNLVKYDFSSQFNHSVFNNDEKLISYWKEMQKKIRKKYGDNDHVATRNMMLELQAPQRLLDIHDMISFSHNEDCLTTNDWTAKIAPYADQRVGPFGVISLQERFDDFAIRYKNRIPKTLTQERIKELQDAMFKTEKQIESQMTIKASEITNATICPYLKSNNS